MIDDLRDICNCPFDGFIDRDNSWCVLLKYENIAIKYETKMNMLKVGDILIT